MVGYRSQGPLSAHLEMFSDTDGLHEEMAEERGRIVQGSFQKHTRSNKRLELQERKNV